MNRGIIFSFISAILTIAGVGLVKRWITDHQSVYYIAAMILFTISSLVYIEALKFERMAILEVFFGTMVMLLTIAMGLFLFHERVSIQEWVGIGLALVASVLLAVKF